MMRIALLGLCLCFFLLSPDVIAQEKISPNQTIARKIEPGKTELFSMPLNDGDYVKISIGYKGKINFLILDPEGTLGRRLLNTSGEAKGSFAFVAEGAGTYSFKIENPGDQSASYEFALAQPIGLNERLKPEPWSDPYPTKRIQTLRDQIAAGQPNTESFWKQVAAEGTPLIEPFGSDGKYHLVTFLWRSTHETRNVLFLSAIWGVGAPAAYAMHQIPDSDVWYLTLKLPRGARFSYQLSPNDPMTSDGPRDAQRAATRQADPLNLHPLSKC